MENILIFKTDRIGDLLNISPVIVNIKKNYPQCNIYLICSDYNYSIAKYYKNLVKPIIFKKPFIKFLLSNKNDLLKIKFDLVLQLDGKNHSYLSSIFIKSNIKSGIKFIKSKKFFLFKYFSHRPVFPINKFFNNLENCDENYELKNNMSYHYLSLYLKLLEKSSFKIFSKKHYFPITDNIKSNDFNKYILFHIDERWINFDETILNKLISKIKDLSKVRKVFVTTNLHGNVFYEKLIKSIKEVTNINIIENSTIDDMVKIIYNSSTVVSCHTGIIVHFAACFDKNIIDTVPKSIFNELDRWIPLESKYKRYDIDDLDKIII